jgi:hypothetical protein
MWDTTGLPLKSCRGVTDPYMCPRTSVARISSYVATNHDHACGFLELRRSVVGDLQCLLLSTTLHVTGHQKVSYAPRRVSYKAFDSQRNSGAAP